MIKKIPPPPRKTPMLDELLKDNRRLKEELSEKSKALEESQERYRRLLDAEDDASRKFCTATSHCINAIFTADSKGVIEFVNPVFESFYGFPASEMTGANMRGAVFAELSDEEWSEVWKTVSSGTRWNGVFRMRKKDGGSTLSNTYLTPVKSPDRAISHFIGVQEDMSNRRVTEENVRYLTDYDKVTGLYNRSHFIELLNAALSGAQFKQGILLLLDIDQFKLINDIYGHGLGDEFLHKVAMVLKTALRFVEDKGGASSVVGRKQFNFIGRLSGDEFAVFLPSLVREQGLMAAERFRKTLEGFYHSDVSGHATASIGVSVYPEHGANAAELLTKADAAMYKAKDLGRNKCHVFAPEDQYIETMKSRLHWKNSIVRALKDDLFVPWFQPIMDIREESITHYEALARMQENDGAVVQPGVVIDIAERFGLINSIDQMIISKAMRLHSTLEKNAKGLNFCMNVSGKNVGDEAFLSFLKDALGREGVDPKNFIFEITETSAVSDLSKAAKFIKELKSIGCRIAMDDFGVGFSSFMYLREMEVDYIKIAGSFIKSLDQNLNDRLFVKAITEVAKGMGIRIIAEFVERKETLDILRDLGVDYAQGFMIGRPATEIPG
ncbi:MAG: EAL domain-containing protein [Deltaproteobacteria bacterium]|nr:EAL domain-containing protein [Deltaproteobacteria bacterium]